MYIYSRIEQKVQVNIRANHRAVQVDCGEQRNEALQLRVGAQDARESAAEHEREAARGGAPQLRLRDQQFEKELEQPKQSLLEFVRVEDQRK